MDNNISDISQQHLPYGRAICYSGFRRGQNPGAGIFPSQEEILEDLRILEKDWQYIRLYDVDIHGERVLKVIHQHGLDLKVLLGICLGAEVSNPNCPWGADFSELRLAANKEENQRQIEKLATLANDYADIVIALSAGNEATVEWNDHMVPVERVVHYADYLKNHAAQPVTFCENYVPWQGKLDPLAEKVDIISIHTYPLWEYKSIEEALAYTEQNYLSVKRRFPDKQVIITEAGWATGSNGRGMPPQNASQENQERYCQQLLAWADEKQIPVFLFEAFDEDWKGSDDPMEPEKHWGIYDIDRRPKRFLRSTELIDCLPS